ncbi:MAG: PAS domain S-box protein [Synechococcales bacterium]|nr:PAS domain S-box protein [Synechococcales bacterium]
MKILVVEDDQAIAQTLEFLFSRYNYAVDIAIDAEAGLQMAEAFAYDLMVLDLFLPKGDGISLCQHLRNQGFSSPILLLTGQGDRRQKAIALNAGADDYVVKPFDTEELIARVQALLRRGGPTNQPVLTWGLLSVDPSSCKVAYGAHRLSVTPKEYAILELFLRHPQRTFNARAILDHVWTSLESPGEEAVRVHIKELRQKLKSVGAPRDFIETKHRMGYRLNARYSNLLVSQVEQQASAPQIAELTAVNEELRLTLEELQITQEELRQQNEQLQSTQQPLELDDQRYQNLFEHAPDAYLVTDRYGAIREANRAAAILFRVDAQDLVGKPLLVLITEGDRYDFNRRLTDLEFAQNWEVTIQLKNGETFPVWMVVTSIKNSEDEITSLCWSLRDLRPCIGETHQAPGRYLATLREMSDRYPAELALRASEARLNQILDSAIASIASFRVFADQHWEYDYFSKGCETLFGYTVEEFMADPTLWLSRVFPEDREAIILPLVEEFRAERDAIAKFRFYHKDGSLRWIASTHASQKIADQCWQVTVVNHDITAWKQAESKIREQAALLDIASDAIIVRDLNNRIVYWNQGAERLYGWSTAEVIGQKVSVLLRCQTSEISAAIQTLLKRGHWQGELDKVTKAGKTVTVAARWTLLQDETGQPKSILTVATDITEKKQMEAQYQQAQRWESLGENSFW